MFVYFSLSELSFCLQGIEGFDDLRQTIKNGSDASREIAAIIAER